MKSVSLLQNQGGTKVGMKEVEFLNLLNMSDEIVGPDGKQEHFEAALDSGISWIWAAITKHKSDEIEIFIDDKFAKTTVEKEYIRLFVTMKARNDDEKLKRMDGKERFLSLLLDIHGMDLKENEKPSYEPLQKGELDVIIQGESSQNGIADDIGPDDQ